MSITAKNSLHDSTKIYTRPALKIYDLMVMNLLARAVWHCPPSLFVDLYDALVTTNHAEIGVGTGYCLDHCRARIGRLTLIDLNPNCVEHAGQRLQRFAPTMHVRDVLEPIDVGGDTFQSIALGGVLHCLPGSMPEKGRVFDHLRPIASKNTVVFGYTLISDSGALGPAALATRALLNKRRVINNCSDTSDDLRFELGKRFEKFLVARVGALAFFIASKFSNKEGEDNASAI